MAKHKLARKAVEKEHGVIVTTSRGQRVRCLPTQAVIDHIRELYEGRKPEPPSYIITDVAGSEEKRFYNDKSITGPDVPQEDKDKWADYLTEVARIDSEYNEHVMRVLAVECVEILDMPPEEEWVKRDKWTYGDSVIPDDTEGRLHHYFVTKVIGTREDGYNIMLGIHKASGVDEEVLSKLEATFRHPVEDEERADAESDKNDSAPNEPQ